MTEYRKRLFWKHVDRGGDDECWEWTAGTNPCGYGTMWNPEGSALVHRVSYEIAWGPIPKGMVIDHLCHGPECRDGDSCPHRRCVNPAHLAMTTHTENLNRTWNKAKTHCPQGHPYDEANTYRRSTGGRSCRACGREATKRYLARLRQSS